MSQRSLREKRKSLPPVQESPPGQESLPARRACEEGIEDLPPGPWRHLLLCLAVMLLGWWGLPAKGWSQQEKGPWLKALRWRSVFYKKRGRRGRWSVAPGDVVRLLKKKRRRKRRRYLIKIPGLGSGRTSSRGWQVIQAQPGKERERVRLLRRSWLYPSPGRYRRPRRRIKAKTELVLKQRVGSWLLVRLGTGSLRWLRQGKKIKIFQLPPPPRPRIVRRLVPRRLVPRRPSVAPASLQRQDASSPLGLETFLIAGLSLLLLAGGGLGLAYRRGKRIRSADLAHAPHDLPWGALSLPTISLPAPPLSELESSVTRMQTLIEAQPVAQEGPLLPQTVAFSPHLLQRGELLLQPPDLLQQLEAQERKESPGQKRPLPPLPSWEQSMPEEKSEELNLEIIEQLLLLRKNASGPKVTG